MNDNNFEIKFNNSNNHSAINKIGGDSQKWKNFLSDLGLNVERQSQNVGKDMVNSQSELNNPYGQNPYSIALEKICSFDDLVLKIRKYAETQTDLKSTTIEKRIKKIELMADKKQAFPIDFLNPSVEQFNYHMTWYRENIFDENTGVNYYGLRERKNAFYLYLEACGISEKFFPYRLPRHPEFKPIEFPSPDIAYKLTAHEYYKNKELNWFWQFAHLYNLIVGPRAPSEMAIMQIKWIDWDSCTIKFPQPKLRGKIRKIMLPEVFIKGKTRKSLKNFIDYHRSKLPNADKTDYLFISPWTGKPYWAENDRKLAITKSANLGKCLNQTGKVIYPRFYPYMGRHFCATGILIKKYVEKHHDPVKSTMHFMGHSKITTTQRYTSLSEEYFEKYPYNWFRRILKGREKCRGKYAEKPKQAKKTFVSYGNPSRNQYSPAQGLYLITEVISNETKHGFKRFGFLSNSLKSFFFSFFHFLHLSTFKGVSC